MEKIPNRREIIDRKKLMAELTALGESHKPDSLDFRNSLLKTLKETMANGKEVLKQRFFASNKGRPSMYANAFLIDQIIRAIYDAATTMVYPLNNPTPEEKLSLLAVGGYGRGELAPQSDVDLLFLFPYKQTSWSEQVIEYCLYMLWDLEVSQQYSSISPNRLCNYIGNQILIHRSCTLLA